MASTDPQGNIVHGAVGGVTHYIQNGTRLARTSKYNRTDAGRTPKSMASRTLTANVNNAWKVLGPYLRNCFERTQGTDFHRFLSLNRRQARVRLTAEEAKNQCCVIDHFAVSYGSLPRIEVRQADGYLLSNLPTDLDDDRLHPGDGILFLRLTQHVRNGLPFAKLTGHLLEIGDANPPVGSDGFLEREGLFACKQQADSLVAWIHLRQEKGQRKASPQLLVGENSLLTRYTGDEALSRAIASYDPNPTPAQAPLSTPADGSRIEAKLDHISAQLDRLIALMEGKK